MHKRNLKSVVLSVGLLAGAGSGLANAALPETQPEIALAFDAGVPASLEVLDATGMEQTRGQLWPMILTVAAVDIALSSYFWGVYIPQYAAPAAGTGLCPTCEIPGSRPR